MATIKMIGLKKVTRKLASGNTEIYWYAWAGGPRLDGKPGTPEFVASYNRAVNAKPQVVAGTIVSLIASFKSSAEFKGLSDSSKRAYGSYIELIEKKFGTMPLAALDDKRSRGIFKAWRDGMADTPRKADYAWTVLARIFSFGKDRGACANPCERGGRIYEVDRTDIIWREEDLSKLFAVASKEVRDVVMVALWTGQRQGDVLALNSFAYDGKTVRLKQSKTGRNVSIPAARELRAVLDPLREREGAILRPSVGEKWTSDGFRASFGKACKKAEITGLRFHDLRGTAVTRLALAGCTTLEIAAITGHSPKDVDTILDKHYLGERAKLAESAIYKLETRTKLGKRKENGRKS